MKAVTTSARVSSAVLVVDSYRVEFSFIEPVVPIAGMVPVPEALVSSTSPSPSPSRLSRERLFCPEAEGDGSKAGRLGMVMGVGSTCVLS